jgi:hypothetical protein
MRNGIVRLAVLAVWAIIVFAAGGGAVKLGASQVATGGVELLALVAGISAVMASGAWSRSIGRSRERV